MVFANLVSLELCKDSKSEYLPTWTWVNNIFREEATSVLAGFHAGPLSYWAELEFGDVASCGGRKTLGVRRQQTQPACGTGSESNPGHINGRRVLSPLGHLCGYKSSQTHCATEVNLMRKFLRPDQKEDKVAVRKLGVGKVVFRMHLDCSFLSSTLFSGTFLSSCLTLPRRRKIVHDLPLTNIIALLESQLTLTQVNCFKVKVS